MVEKSHTAGWWPDIYTPFRNAGQKIADWFAPASEASSNDNGYRIVMELPGVAEKDIDVSVHNGVLTIKGEKREEKEEKKENYYFSERSYGSFQRSFRLPDDAVEGDIAADIKDGVLTVSVPKSLPKQAEAKKISVKKAK